MENPKIRIESDGKRTDVYLDGELVDGVISVEFSHEVDTVPILNLKITR